MGDAEEATVLQTFQEVCDNPQGKISRTELAQVFQELDTWGSEDLEQMLNFFDRDGFGLIKYKEFVAWAMAADGGAATLKQQQSMENDAGDSSDDEDGKPGDEDDLEGDNVLDGVNLDLMQEITQEVWINIMQHLNNDDDDAKEIWDQVVEELKQEGKKVDKTIVLKELLEEMKIGLKDLDTLKAIADAMQAGQRGDIRAKNTDPMKNLNSAISKMLIELWKNDAKGPEEIWTYINKGTILFSQSEEACVASFKGAKQTDLVAKVKQAILSPPLLCSCAGQVAASQHGVAEVNAAIERCKAKKEKFVDTDWDLTKKTEPVLYVDKGKPGYDCTVGKPAAYKRLTEIIDKPVLFKNSVSAGDIVQGQIGTCFLLGAMGAMAGHDENAIKKCFIRYDVDIGIYCVRFCHDGEWTYITVDDYMPVDSHNRLLFAKSRDPEEVWCPILEKAFCKFHSCYEMCDGGLATEAISCFFGGCGGKLQVKDKHKKNPASYFKVLKQAQERGWLMTTTFQRLKKGAKSKSAGKCGEEVTPSGLVFGHVYSILQVLETGGNQLIQIRNPWGQGEWEGKWSDKNTSKEWTPEMRKATGFQGGQKDGKFWMSIEDYVANTKGADYARPFGPHWMKITQHGRFRKGLLGAAAQWAYKATNKDEVSFNRGDIVEVEGMNPGWWYGKVQGGDGTKGFFPGNYVKLKDTPVERFDLIAAPTGKDMRVVVVLLQPNTRMMRRFYKRKKDGLNYKDVKYGSMKLVIVGPDGKVVASRDGKKRELSHELKIPAGSTYKIYAMSLDGMGGSFAVRCFVRSGSASFKLVEGASIAEVTAAEEKK